MRYLWMTLRSRNSRYLIHISVDGTIHIHRIDKIGMLSGIAKINRDGVLNQRDFCCLLL